MLHGALRAQQGQIASVRGTKLLCEQDLIAGVVLGVDLAANIGLEYYLVADYPLPNYDSLVLNVQEDKCPTQI
jgi:hypothetical protein